MARFLFEAYQPVVDANGDTVSGAKIFIYEAGTTTPKTVYSDEEMTVPHAFPIVCDSGGQRPAIYAQAGFYKVIIKDSIDVTLLVDDDIEQDAGGFTPDGETYITYWGAGTDKSAAENAAAIEAALEWGGVIKVPSGVFTMNAIAPTLTRDVTLIIPAGSTLKAASDVASALFTVNSGFSFTAEGGGKIDTSEATFDEGTGSATCFSLGFNLTRARIDGLHLYAGSTYQTDHGDSGVSGTAKYVTVTNCLIEGMPDAGVYPAGTATEDASGVYDGPLGSGWNITGNVFRFCQVACAAKRNSWGGSFANNYVTDCGGGFINSEADSGGVTLMGAKGWTVNGNQFHRLKSYAVQLRHTSMTNISDNIVMDFGYSDDGVTPVTTQAIILSGAATVVGDGNLIGFREWATTSNHTALRIESRVFDADGVNTTSIPGRLNFGMSVVNCYRGISFGTDIDTCSGQIRQTTNVVTASFGGTVPPDLQVNTIATTDWSVTQNSTSVFRVIDGQTRAPNLLSRHRAITDWENVGSIVGTNISVTTSFVALQFGSPTSVHDITNASGHTGYMQVTFRNPQSSNVTFVHDADKLRTNTGSNVVVGQHQSVTFMQVTESIWQQI